METRKKPENREPGRGRTASSGRDPSGVAVGPVGPRASRRRSTLATPCCLMPPPCRRCRGRRRPPRHRRSCRSRRGWGRRRARGSCETQELASIVRPAPGPPSGAARRRGGHRAVPRGGAGGVEAAPSLEERREALAQVLDHIVLDPGGFRVRYDMASDCGHDRSSSSSRFQVGGMTPAPILRRLAARPAGSLARRRAAISLHRGSRMRCWLRMIGISAHSSAKRAAPMRSMRRARASSLARRAARSRGSTIPAVALTRMSARHRPRVAKARCKAVRPPSE